ncbi:MAG: hypothetical protein ACREYE_33880, partial [Gammaproteobacteria bacterium]
ARHVTWDPLLRDHVGVTGSSRGQNGYARVYGASPWEDLVSLALIGGTVTYLPSGVTPQPGDMVYWFEYDFRTQANAYRARRRMAEVIRSVARHLLFDATPTPGASGTCLLNASGEVVGIVIASDAMEDQRAVGVAVQLDPDLFQ